MGTNWGVRYKNIMVVCSYNHEIYEIPMVTAYW